MTEKHKVVRITDIPEVFAAIWSERSSDSPTYIASLLEDRLEPGVQKRLEAKRCDPSLLRGVLTFKHELWNVLNDESLDQESPSYFLLGNIYSGLDGLFREVINASESIPIQLSRILTYDESDWTPRQMGQLVMDIVQSRLASYTETPSDQLLVQRMEPTIPLVLRTVLEVRAGQHDRLCEIARDIKQTINSNQELKKFRGLDQSVGIGH